jgi:hypothetical protein
MAQFTMTIALNNAAFSDYPDIELSIIIGNVVKDIERGIRFRTIYDNNGNVIGQFEYQPV